METIIDGETTFATVVFPPVERGPHGMVAQVVVPHASAYIFDSGSTDDPYWTKFEDDDTFSGSLEACIGHVILKAKRIS